MGKRKSYVEKTVVKSAEIYYTLYKAKPDRNRAKRGGEMGNALKFPIGIESFEEIRRENFYYVNHCFAIVISCSFHKSSEARPK